MHDTRPLSSLRPEHPVPRSLSQLIAEFALDSVQGAEGVEIRGITLDSHQVEAGDLYVGVAGRRTHGAAFASAAASSGAVAVLTDPEGAALAADSGLPVLITPDPRAALGDVAAWIYRTGENTSTLLGVTGTNGKTSVVYLLDALLRRLGVVSGLSSTAERRIGDVAVVSSLTTPEASELHGLLARMQESAVRAVSIEVSAQALSRHRIDGLVFAVVGFTNLSHDHLDDYSDMEEYFEAKAGLFEPERARRGVVTVDSVWGRRLAERSRIPVATLATSSVQGLAPETPADWWMTVIEATADSTTFRLDGPQNRSVVVNVSLIGWYMAANTALAIVMLVESGFDLDAITHALDDSRLEVYIPGRAELVSGERGPRVYVDYGHTPDAFSNALEALRAITPGRVIMVFGADGDRDRTKRGAMGSIAARLADVVIVTDFHPRWEDPAAIRAALLTAATGAVPDREIHEVPDPRSAVRAAIALAREGDSILYAGPGHEDYQEIAGVHMPYSARDDVRQALREAGWL
ncbi:Mur ligase family protein [Rathayibacter toxicus]|uniref:UDP-N-acetylmuramyl-tripeptide synthetase n=1 Tax=Rathayibacter toxicus TaxID=145458 RepID=A0A0C5B9H5_9MICO|nr:UDP-N-acetylmuramoyl-L-alanyl-D-glutamate--2,6-diaminopimelate ligase [Rathayibacter toxicus]AJM77473.1 UDP-N-acetylmuramyl peptide synthase [Rathayibacter toxicus]ALS56619.1 UDP-N-acetylmuramyl peptide synthase [Rathayibacter toxicus]KKM44711.1 UDP-N-acetylmuramyl peptide synthase [Rathayibacter toxicus]PPG21551.1 UDP-N-acetylmuramoyl-L-alanyl-D-glutamate--2,6-diaminopimelate ligase [Rathayibacter toxicus]PPG46515.1 UDP-N-acetylmuramoyl-L-alanyl-D-glutamate--2,6-diaminopimelate ligase [Rat